MMKQQKLDSKELCGFLDHFGDLKDPRSHRNRRHTMAEILLVTLCACICGADGWQDVENFGKAKKSFLKKFLPYKNRIPSDDTYRRFFRALDPDSFQVLFRRWVKQMFPQAKELTIAIDGKSARRSFDNDKAMLHMVNAYATEINLVLAQEKVEDKSNEIKAIPELIDTLDARGATVTIDAMGCQYAIGNKIVKKGGNYVFALKKNQKGLFDDVQGYLSDPELKGPNVRSCESFDKGHGRIEIRKCYISTDIAWLSTNHPKWKTIKSIIRIDSTRIINEEKTCETRYYISSRDTTPEKMLACIRSHWAIENQLHWVLDMSFGEDQSRIRKENAPHIMAIIRQIALNLLQSTKKQMKRQSIRGIRKMGGWNDETLEAILSQGLS